MALNAAVAASLSDLMIELGGISADRVGHQPAPGTATLRDLFQINSNGSLVELIDGALVEKAMG